MVWFQASVCQHELTVWPAGFVVVTIVETFDCFNYRLEQLLGKFRWHLGLLLHQSFEKTRIRPLKHVWTGLSRCW